MSNHAKYMDGFNALCEEIEEVGFATLVYIDTPQGIRQALVTHRAELDSDDVPEMVTRAEMLYGGVFVEIAIRSHFNPETKEEADRWIEARRRTCLDERQRAAQDMAENLQIAMGDLL